MRCASVLVALSLSSLVSATCDINVTPPENSQMFYPPGSIRRNETGAVAVELRVEFGKEHPLDVKIVQSSGFPDLDQAALKLANSFAIHTDCLTGVVKRVVHFEKDPDPPRPAYTDAYFSGETYIWVED